MTKKKKAEAVETEKAVESAVETVETEKAVESAEKCVYCGPSVRGVAHQYTTFVGGVPKALDDFLESHPAARGLVVSVERFPAVRERLSRPGTAEAMLYKKIKSEM